MVVYKGKPTHHVIKPNDNGVMAINGKVYGEQQTTLNGVLSLILLVGNSAIKHALVGY